MNKEKVALEKEGMDSDVDKFEEEEEEEEEDDEDEDNDDDDDDDDEDEDEEEHNGNAPPGLVRVKLHRDDSMTKVKLFDPETMENEHDLKQDAPEEKPLTPLRRAKMKASPY